MDDRSNRGTMFLVYALLWAAIVWYLAITLRLALRSGKVFVISTFMWADKSENPMYFWLGIYDIKRLLVIFVGIAIVAVVAFLRQISN
jgi:hypothetical protein